MAKVNELATALAAIQQQMEALKKQLEEKTAAKTQTDAGFAQVDEAMKKLQGEFDQLMEKNTAAQEQLKVFSDSYGPK
jgi:peptidoglycan hydrolase CwlO-like protein